MDKYEDVIDSREVSERIAELEGEALSRYEDTLPEGESPSYGEIADLDYQAHLDEDEYDEYQSLKALARQGEDSPDWEFGETLIRDSYFVEYAQDLAESIGAIPSDLSWPVYAIDWERAARDLRMDYFSVDFDGVTYWIHA